MAWDPALETAFNPKAIAIVGASSDARRDEPRSGGGAGFIQSYEQLGFPGRIYPVNPKAGEILGYKAYPNVSSLPEHVDLVIVSVPAPAVPAVLEDCIKADARNIHIFTAGFDETGEAAGKELAEKVRKIARRGGLRIIGPNCMGLYVPKGRIGTFGQLPTESGPVAFIAQSGGHCNWFSHHGADYGISFSKVVSFGNAYVLDSTDFLEYLANDRDTGIITLYLEGVKDGRRLLELVREINRVKPVILWKAGLTESGSRAAASHTGSLAGEAVIWHGFFRQTGAVPAFSMEEIAEVTMAFLNLKPPKGKRVGILGVGGGSSVAAADTCAREGLEVPALTEKTRNKLREFVPLAGASIRNPLDTGMAFRDVSVLEDEMELVAADPMIDMLIVMPYLHMVQQAGLDQTERLINFLCDFSGNSPHGKPMAVVFQSFANDAWEKELRNKLLVELPGRGVAIYSSLSAASRALSRFAEYHRFRRELID